MSSLLSKIPPWIEDTCYKALLNGPRPQRTKMAQVLECHKSLGYFMIHDGNSCIICIPSTKSHVEETATGCIVNISDWNVSLLQHVASRECLQHLRQSMNGSSPLLCLDVAQVTTLGGHDTGIFGDPNPIHLSVKIRQAMLHLESKQIAPEQQLKLSPPLGNVETLLNEEQQVDTLLNMAEQEEENRGCNNKSGPPQLGNINDLLEGENNNDTVDRLMEMAQEPTGGGTTAEEDDRKRPALETNNNNSGPPQLGNVNDLLEGENNNDTVDRLFEMAREPNSGTPDEEDDRKRQALETNNNNNNSGPPQLGNVNDLLEGGNNQDTVDRLMELAQEPNGGTTEETRHEDDDTAKQASLDADGRRRASTTTVEPFALSEITRRRKSSLVSLTGLRTAVSSVLGQTAETQDSDDDEIHGISDMLISQTQQDEGMVDYNLLENILLQGRQRKSTIKLANGVAQGESDSD